MKYWTTVKEAWEVFRDMVIPKTVPPDHVEAHRQTFYAAFQTAYSTMIAIAFDPSVPPDMLKSFKKELEDFQEDMKRKSEL